MKKTLQDQYLLIKEGKGHKGVFLADAKRDFPQYVPNAATFEEAAASLKTKNIINENIINVMPINYIEPTKKQPYELAFESFLSEAKKKKENEDEKVKAEEKKVSKPVEKDLEKQFDNKDDKNPDNLIFDQIMMGYYTEMKDPKNADKTMQQLKDMVIKNLTKDPIHYTKDGQFGVKGLGYVTEAPGLGEPKEAKGKWKSSGYGDLKENKTSLVIYPNKTKINYKGEPVTIISNFMNRNDEFIQYEIQYENGKTSEISSADKNITKIATESLNESKEIDSFISNVKKAFTEKPDKKFTPEEIEAKLNQLYPGRAERKKDNSPEETKLREIIREMVDAELDEAYQLMNINPIKSDKEREERDPQPFLTVYLSNSTEELLKKNQHLRVLKNPKNPEEITGVAIRSRFIAPQNLKKLPYDINPMFISFLNTANNIGGEVSLPTREGVMDKYTLLNNVNVGRDGRLSFKTPNPKYQKPVEESEMESLRESIEKELAAINKEAEHEILQSKLDKVQDLIDKKQSQISKLDEDEDMKALTDVKKVKEIQKDIKALEKAKSKIDKMMGKHKGKKKEVIDETEDDLDKMSPEDLDNLESWKQDSDIGQGEELDIEEEY